MLASTFMQELEEKRLEMKAEESEKMANNKGSKTTQLTALQSTLFQNLGGWSEHYEGQKSSCLI